MSPIQTNTQRGIVVKTAASSLVTAAASASVVGCFATLDTAGKAVLPSANGLALFVISDYSALPGSTYGASLQPLEPGQNMRVISAAVITAGDSLTTDANGKAVVASTGGNILAIAEEAAVSGQYVLVRPLGGIQTK